MGGGGALRGPDDQPHGCQSEPSYSMMPKLLVFILKTRSDQILAKLINQSGVCVCMCVCVCVCVWGGGGGVAAALFSSRRPKNFENEKNFLCLKIAEIDMGVNFGSRRTILDIKTHFLKS